MSVTETRTPFIGAPMKRKEDRALLLGQGTYVDNLTVAGQLVMAVVRSPYARARITSIDTCCRQGGRRRRRRLHRRRPSRRLEELASLRLAGDRGDAVAGAFPACDRRGALPGRRCRRRRGRVARPREGRCGTGRRRLRAAPRGCRASRRRSGTPRRSSTNRSARTSVTCGSSRPTMSMACSRRRTSSVSNTYYQPRLIPNAIEPRAVLAQVGARRRRHGAFGDPGAAHLALRARARARDRRGAGARDRARRRRGVRLEARRLRRGSARRRARAQAPPAGEVDRGAFGGISGDDSRPRFPHEVRARRDQGRQDPRLPRRREGRYGRVPAARHAGDPAARRLGVRRSVRHRCVLGDVHRRLHEHDADRRLSRARDGPKRRM